jgi:hypothetical protein
MLVFKILFTFSKVHCSIGKLREMANITDKY